jgi:dinuclear metal center YbgI/SA1388 family protein
LILVRQLMEAIDRMAPWSLAESWDNSGLQIGSDAQEIKHLMVALDLNEQVLNEGLDRQVDGFLTHHPFFFRPVSRIDYSAPSGRLLQLVTTHKLFVISAHTNIDKSRPGLNDYLADRLGLDQLEPLQRAASQLVKLTVFVPGEYSAKLRSAMAQAGAGQIGAYDQCSFSVAGTGTFRPGPDAKPWTGTPGRIEEVAEIALEMRVRGSLLPDVLQAIHANHPYEEPVIDVTSLIDRTPEGLGRIGRLPQPIRFGDYLQTIKERLGVRQLRVTGDPDRPVRTIALCSGSGGSLLDTVISRSADLFITGDLDYHQFMKANDHRLAVVDAGHWGTEHWFIPMIAGYLQEYFRGCPGFEVASSSTIQEEPYLSI